MKICKNICFRGLIPSLRGDGKKKESSLLSSKDSLGDRDRIHTCNRLILRQILYSVELRGQNFQ